MANFKKFLAGTLVTAAAAVCGVAVYKKIQENKAANDDDFDDFDDDDFDDDFEDLDIENRNYTSISADAVVATEDEDDTKESDSVASATSSTDDKTDSYSSAYSKDDYSTDNSFYSRGSY